MAVMERSEKTVNKVGDSKTVYGAKLENVDGSVKVAISSDEPLGALMEGQQGLEVIVVNPQSRLENAVPEDLKDRVKKGDVQIDVDDKPEETRTGRKAKTPTGSKALDEIERQKAERESEAAAGAVQVSELDKLIEEGKALGLDTSKLNEKQLRKAIEKARKKQDAGGV
jgi:hypothetical protein